MPDFDIVDILNEKLESFKESIEEVSSFNEKPIEQQNQNELHPKTQDVIGEDDRTRITPTTSYPWRSIVKLYMTWGSDRYIGSGALIDKNHVLTAGHCVYYLANGGWADSIKVVPAMDNGIEPYGHAWATEMRVYFEWMNSQKYYHDFAVLTLDRDIGLQTGWMELMTADHSSSFYTGELNVAGYPGDLDYGLNMYWDCDIGRTATEYNHWYYMDVTGGMSGSPVWIYDGTDCYILSICAYGEDGSGSNFGTRIDKNKFDCINNWLTADATGTDKPDMADRGSAYSGFNTTVVGAGLTDFEVWSDVQNLGTYPVILSTVSYYASDDIIITADDYLIGIDEIGSIFSTYYRDSTWTGKFPSDVPSGTYYIGWILDADDTLDEFNENNNVHYVKNKQLLVDATPPSNPTVCKQLNGTTESNVWQDLVNDPCFNWNGAFDFHTDVAGYYYYWGTDPNGVSSTFTSLSEYDPSAVSTGTYYLRVRTKDTVGNNASWTTLYTFKYNETLNEDNNNYQGDPKENQDDKSVDNTLIAQSNNLNLDDLLFDISGIEIHVAIWITCGILSIFIHFYFKRKKEKFP
ncbi:MAG: trypsin-like serine protease [Promethearchaeota archaeon]